MRKMSGQLVSAKPISLSRAAKIISLFAAVDNGSIPTVSMYLQQTADAFNRLQQFHERRFLKNSSMDQNFSQIPRINDFDGGLDGERPISSRKRSKAAADDRVQADAVSESAKIEGKTKTKRKRSLSE